MPSVFALAADPNADIKARWDAFDQVYAFVAEEMDKKGMPLQPGSFETKDLTDEQIRLIAERSKRTGVAIWLLGQAYGTSEEALSAIMWQAEELVPTQPDPDTMRPQLTMKDQVLLYESLSIMPQEFPEDWECFFKASSVPVERRKLAFRRMYGCVGSVWREKSLFARTLTPLQRQFLVMLALMCFVPADQWTQKDLDDLRAELLPVEEPDWESLARELGPPTD